MYSPFYYCKECSLYLRGEDEEDFSGLCDKKECVAVTCDHCGFILVDHTGLNVRRWYSGSYFNKAT